MKDKGESSIKWECFDCPKRGCQNVVNKRINAIEYEKESECD